MDRTDSKIDTPLAQSGSPSVRDAKFFIVRDTNDDPWGPFESAYQAAIWADKKWPGRADDTWDVVGIRPPD